MLEHRPVQINYHRVHDCCPSRVAAESFRFAQLLANKACVLSQRSHARDEAFLRGIVRFVDGNEVDAALAALQDGDTLRRCREESYRGFKSRWSSSALLRASGFLQSDAWRDLM